MAQFNLFLYLFNVYGIFARSRARGELKHKLQKIFETINNNGGSG